MKPYWVDSFPGRELISGGTRYLYFGGTAYLGLQQNRDFQKILKSQIDRYGSNYGASRKSNIRLTVYDEVERYLANWVGSESCVTVSSGFMAGQLLHSYFKSRGHALFHAPRSHAATQGPDTIPFDSYIHLGKALENYLKENPDKKPIVFCDSVDFTQQGFPSFTGLKNLPLDKCVLVADDSHGIGVVGAQGKGCYQMLKSLNASEVVVCCSLGKGLAVQAGAIFGRGDRIEELTDTPFFGGASPAAPAFLATIPLAESIFREQRGLLRENMARFERSLPRDFHFFTMIAHPTYSFQNLKLVKSLEENRILVTHFGYPRESDEATSRIVLSAHHTARDISKLTQAFDAALPKEIR